MRWPFKKEVKTEKISLTNISPHSVLNPNGTWWQILIYKIKGKKWKLIRQYEVSMSNFEYRNPVAYADYQFYNEMGRAYLNLIERESIKCKSYFQQGNGEYKIEMFLTNGHGQILEELSKEFRVGTEVILEKKIINNKKVENLIKLRDKARKEKNFELADKIRNKLKKSNVVLQDIKDEGTIWRIL